VVIRVAVNRADEVFGTRRAGTGYVLAELALQHGQLVPQHEDLRVLVLVTARQQPQQREHVRDTQVGQP
jgi:hypothetical protein